MTARERVYVARRCSQDSELSDFSQRILDKSSPAVYVNAYSNTCKNIEKNQNMIKVLVQHKKDQR